MRCLISLRDVNELKNDGISLDVARRALFGRDSVSLLLPYTRADIFSHSASLSKGMSISGVQQKLSLKVEGQLLQPTSVDGEYILKPSPIEYPHAAENEHVCMIMSGVFGINTAKCGLAKFSDGELVYIVKRFDKEPDGTRYAQEDLTQAQGLDSTKKYQGTYELAGKALFTMTGGKLVVMQDYLRRIIFSYVIGNGDMHLKNLSVQRLAGNTSAVYDRLTPNYDQLSTTIYPGLDGAGFLALGLLSEKDNSTDEEAFSAAYEKFGYYTGSDFIELGLRLGLPTLAAKNEVDLFIARQDLALASINQSFLPATMKKSLAGVVTERVNALKHC